MYEGKIKIKKITVKKPKKGHEVPQKGGEWQLEG
jgi:hypothetical protein